MTSVGQRPRSAFPRLASLTLGVCVVAHIGAAYRSLRASEWIPGWHWALLALVEFALFAVVLAVPHDFTTRNFRLPGVFVAAIGLVILVPLPAAVRRYGTQIPRSSVLGIAAGLAAVAFVFAVGLRRRPETESPHEPPVRGPSESLLPLGIVLVALLVLPLWLRSIGSLPILDLIRGTSAVDAALARDAALDSLSNPAVRFAVGTLRNIYLLYAIAWVVAAVTVTRRSAIAERRGRMLVAVVVLGVGGVFALVTTERSILGQMVLAAFVGGLVASRRRLSLSGLAVVGAGIVAFPLFFGLRAGVGGLDATVRGFTRRVFFVPDDVMMRYFAEFPADREFLHGSSVPKLSWITGGETFDLAGFIYTQYFQYDTRLVGNANASFFGVGWANGGVIGVVIWSIMVAVALVALERLVGRFEVRTGAALRAVAVIQTALLTSGDVTRTVLGFGPGILDLVAVAAALRAIDRRRQLTRRSPISTGRRQPASDIALATPT